MLYTRSPSILCVATRSRCMAHLSLFQLGFQLTIPLDPISSKTCFTAVPTTRRTPLTTHLRRQYFQSQTRGVKTVFNNLRKNHSTNSTSSAMASQIELSKPSAWSSPGRSAFDFRSTRWPLSKNKYIKLTKLRWHNNNSNYLYAPSNSI